MQKMSQRPHSYLNYINMIWRVEWFLCERFFTKFKVHHGSSIYIYVYIYPSLPELASGNWIRHSRKYPMNIDDLPEKSWWMLNCNICNGKQRLFITTFIPDSPLHNSEFGSLEDSLWYPRNDLNDINPLNGIPDSSFCLNCHKVRLSFRGFPMRSIILVPRNPWRIHLHSAQLILTG